jgi:hypothetical protein
LGGIHFSRFTEESRAAFLETANTAQVDARRTSDHVNIRERLKGQRNEATFEMRQKRAGGQCLFDAVGNNGLAAHLYID